MGTTADALEDQEGVRTGFALIIEGLDFVITDSSNLGAVTTAYAGTGYEKGLPGLKIEGAIRQGIKPFQSDIDVSTLTFRITPNQDDYGEGVDVLGRTMFKMKPTYRTQLTSLFQAAADGSGTLAVKDAQTQGWGSSGTLYAGNKAFRFSSAGAGAFTIPAGGAQVLYPFAADSGLHFSRPILTPGQQFHDQGAAGWITSEPTKWIHRKVALYIHRIVGGVWDTRAQAHLEFAGRIAEIEQGELGETIIHCEDIRADIADCTLFKGQWTAYVKPGCRLQAGEAIYIGEDDDSNNVDDTSGTAALTVVESGASGDDEIDEGYYTAEQLVTRISNAVSAVAGLNGAWACEMTTHDGARRVRFRAAGLDTIPATAAVVPSSISIITNARHIFEFLGYQPHQIHRLKSDKYKITGETEGSGNDAFCIADGPAYRVRPFHEGAPSNEMTIELESGDSFGDFVDLTDFLPAPYDTWPAAGEVWSFFVVGERLFFGRYDSATKLSRVTSSVGLGPYAEGPTKDRLAVGITIDDEGDRLEVKQCVVIAGSFSTIMASVFASTSGEGVNHATYDVFPSALSCPGIPWGLLGTPFIESCQRLDQATKTETMLLFLDKPTPLVDLLPPEALLRFAWLVWKDGNLVFASPPKPTALSTDWDLTEANKAGIKDNERSRVRITSEFLANLITVKYNRTPGDGFSSYINVRDETSISDYGEKKVVIEAPNSFPEIAGTGASVEDLTACLAARTLPCFGKPLYLVSRTIAPTLFGIAPGDTCTLSDNDIRDPTSGEMGLANRAGVILSVSHSYGHEHGDLFGEVEILLTDEDRTYPLAPCAEIDVDYAGTVDGITFTDGYATAIAGGPALKLKSHQHSRSADSVDAVSIIPGEYRIVEVDPADTAAPDAWDRTVVSTDTTDEYVVLNSNLSSPAWSGSTKLYRIVPQLYDDVDDDQQLVTYLADNDDGLIQDVAQPNLYGEYPQSGAFTRAAVSDLPALIPAESYVEGRPLHAGLVQDWIRMGNNLISYKAAPHSPFQFFSLATTVSTSYVWLYTIPFFLGGVAHTTGRRYIKVAARITIANSAQTVSCKVTSSRLHPTGTSAAPVSILGPTSSVTFTHTGDTTETTKTTQDLPIVGADMQGYTWLTVELKTSNAGATASFRGLPTLYLGPIE